MILLCVIIVFLNDSKHLRGDFCSKSPQITKSPFKKLTSYNPAKSRSAHLLKQSATTFQWFTIERSNVQREITNLQRLNAPTT